MRQSNTPHIRLLSAADFEEVRSIEIASQRFPWSETLIQEELAAPHGRHFGAAAGSGSRLFAFILSRLHTGEFHIHNLCTLPEERNRGFATALLRHALAHAVSSGARRAFLDVRSSNAAAIRLYSANDFSTMITRRNYYSNGDDALVMSRLL
ncbi:MAG: ribosomal protein S18-alanine N-acetyltransferase [Chitinispirillaceae bacterium]|nr:ribosomal protein S18-alanine N-acetyltransferase [Chitinispirillaceae bacterium]